MRGRLSCNSSTNVLFASAPHIANNVRLRLYAEVADRSGEGFSHGGYTGHPDAKKDGVPLRFQGFGDIQL